MTDDTRGPKERAYDDLIRMSEEYIRRLERAVENLLNQMDECECDESVGYECYQCRVRRVLNDSPISDPHADLEAAIDQLPGHGPA